MDPDDELDPDADYDEAELTAAAANADDAGLEQGQEPEYIPEKESPQEIVKKVLMTNKIFKVKLTGKESIDEPEEEEEEKKESPEEPQLVEEKFYDHKPCEKRLEQLALPNIKNALETLERYKDVYPPDVYKEFKKRVQEMMAKKPEDIEAEFKKFQDNDAVKKYQAALNKEKRKQYKQQVKDYKKQSMLNILEGALSKEMMKAFFNPKQVISNNRMRRVSNTVLKELSNIRGIAVPDRDSNSLRSQIMVSASDTLAFFIDSLYFELQHQKTTDYDLLKAKQPQLNKCEDEPDYDIEHPYSYKSIRKSKSSKKK